MRIVIVDDHPVVRNGLKQTIALETDLDVIGSAASCEEGLKEIEAKNPDLVVVDLKMPDGSGLELVQRCKKMNLSCYFLVLTAHGSPHEITQALSLKVGGYILKESLPEEIIEAIRRVGKGRRYFDPEVMESAIKGREESPLQRLTARELEVLDAVSAGLSNSAIAGKLHISEKTVKKHISNLLAKLEVEDRIQAALLGFSEGMGKERPEITF